MPTHALVQVSESWSSALPRDLVVNTPCFRWTNFTIQDATSLANNVLDAYDATFPIASTPQTTAKVYDLEGTPPVLPMATVVRRVGVVQQPGSPRETSICLSFSGGQHQPRQRGRIYIPCFKVSNSPAARPTSQQMTSVSGLGQRFYDVGGANVDWIVWSRVARAATGISRWWVDDEWDTQRRRGTRPTTRVQVDK